MSRYQILKYLALIVFILPMFYSHFTVLPGATKYVMDLILVVYFFQYKPLVKQNSLQSRSGFTTSYLGYVIIILLVSFYSVLIHGEKFMFWFQEFRRLVYPFLFYLILTDVFLTDKRAAVKLHFVMFAIYMIQVPVTLIQRSFQSFLRSTPLYSGGIREIHEVDFAMGTLGGGGASFLGVVIPMAMLYFYDLKIFKWSLALIIPLMTIYSGGGVVLTAIALVGLILYLFLAKPFVVKAKLIMVAGVLAGIFVIMYSFPFVAEPVDRYANAFNFYNENYVEGGKETFVNNEHKIDRLNGHKFLRRHMNDQMFEPLIGLGFSFKENDGGLAYQFKSDFNFILAERGFVGLSAYFIFIIAILIGIWHVLKVRDYDDKFIKILYFAIFFIAGFYNASTRSFQIWFMFVYFLTLLENKEQYMSLKNYLHENKHHRRWKERRAQIDSVSGEPSIMS